MLERTTEGRGDLSGPSRKQIEDLERCVDPAQPSFLTITNDIRVIHLIQSVVSERANSANDLRVHHTGSAEECLAARRTEMWEMLRFFDVRGFQRMIPAVSNLPQGDLGRGGALEVSEIIQHPHGAIDADPSLVSCVITSYLFAAPLLLTTSSM